MGAGSISICSGASRSAGLISKSKIPMHRIASTQIKATIVFLRSMVAGLLSFFANLPSILCRAGIFYAKNGAASLRLRVIILFSYST